MKSCLTLNCLKFHHIIHDRIYAPASTLYTRKNDWAHGLLCAVNSLKLQPENVTS